MAKATRQGASMTPEEYANAEYVSPRVRRPEVSTVTVKRKKKTNVSTVEGGAASDGDNSKPDGSKPAENGNGVTNNDPPIVPETENPSSQEEEAPSTVDSADGTARQTNRSGSRKAPAKKAQAPSKRANVRSTDGMDLTF